MSKSTYSPRIGIYGPDDEANQPSKGCNLWPAGYAASVGAAEAVPVTLELPVLAVDRGLHVLNTSFGGTLHTDLPRELPLALQHRHPPEPGVRHALVVTPGTRLAHLYGDGEIVVNSEHTRAVAKSARGFRVSARALDGVIEAIEAETDGWFAMGVQWLPASVTASGLDIQLFRGLVDAAREFHALVPAGLQHAA